MDQASLSYSKLNGLWISVMFLLLKSLLLEFAHYWRFITFA
jgi:hypothetical protein